MQVHDMSAEEHDRCVAHVSHLPHLLSSSLAHCLDEINVDWRSLSGQGLRDTTRIAEGNSDLWEQILLSNKSNVLAALAELESSISLAKNYLANEQGRELREFLETGVHFRKSLNAAEE
jgi:prephenate dehydrogenase